MRAVNTETAVKGLSREPAAVLVMLGFVEAKQVTALLRRSYDRAVCLDESEPHADWSKADSAALARLATIIEAAQTGHSAREDVKPNPTGGKAESL